MQPRAQLGHTEPWALGKHREGTPGSLVHPLPCPLPLLSALVLGQAEETWEGIGDLQAGVMGQGLS